MAYLLCIISFMLATTVAGTASSKRVRIAGEVTMGVFLVATVAHVLMLMAR